MTDSLCAKLAKTKEFLCRRQYCTDSRAPVLRLEFNTPPDARVDRVLRSLARRHQKLQRSFLGRAVWVPQCIRGWAGHLEPVREEASRFQIRESRRRLLGSGPERTPDHGAFVLAWMRPIACQVYPAAIRSSARVSAILPGGFPSLDARWSMVASTSPIPSTRDWSLAWSFSP